MLGKASYLFDNLIKFKKNEDFSKMKGLFFIVLLPTIHQLKMTISFEKLTSISNLNLLLQKLIFVNFWFYFVGQNS